ncbi:MAG: hypothetical protein ACKVOQ_05880 [Cyclobacteriaceae bacterium]
MTKVLLVVFLLLACTEHEKKKQPFPVLAISEDEWASYEGRWIVNGGIVQFELSLKSGAFGYDSYYKLHESFNSDSLACGTSSNGTYSTYNGFANKELGICLHDLDINCKADYLRYKKSQSIDMPDEMFFMTRGNDELLPCDDKFKPITTDRRYTLHKRSKLFTVEGYINFEQDSATFFKQDTATFFERNTRERWRVTDLGEFNELRLLYKKLAKEKFEGVYLKALAYSVLDTTQRERNALVIKRIVDVGNDPD